MAETQASRPRHQCDAFPFRVDFSRKPSVASPPPRTMQLVSLLLIAIALVGVRPMPTPMPIDLTLPIQVRADPSMPAFPTQYVANLTAVSAAGNSSLTMYVGASLRPFALVCYRTIPCWSNSHLFSDVPNGFLREDIPASNVEELIITANGQVTTYTYAANIPRDVTFLSFGRWLVRSTLASTRMIFG